MCVCSVDRLSDTLNIRYSLSLSLSLSLAGKKKGAQSQHILFFHTQFSSIVVSHNTYNIFSTIYRIQQIIFFKKKREMFNSVTDEMFHFFCCFPILFHDACVRIKEQKDIISCIYLCMYVFNRV